MNLNNKKIRLNDELNTAKSDKVVNEYLISFWENEKKEKEFVGKVGKYVGGTSLGAFCCLFMPYTIYNIVQGQIDYIQIGSTIALLPIGFLSLYLSNNNYKNAEKDDQQIKYYKNELEKSNLKIKNCEVKQKEINDYEMSK